MGGTERSLSGSTWPLISANLRHWWSVRPLARFGAGIDRNFIEFLTCRMAGWVSDVCGYRRYMSIVKRR